VLLPPERQDEEVSILALLVRGERADHYETERVAKNGHALQVSLSVSPIKDASGRIVGNAKIASEFTALVLTTRQTREANWSVAGPRGAVARLGMKRMTVHSLIRRLDISRPV